MMLPIGAQRRYFAILMFYITVAKDESH
jgi:hypothetical protein